MASLHAISPPHSFLPLSNHRKHISKTLPGSQILTCPKLFHNSILSRNKHKSDCFVVNSLVQDEFAVIPVQSEDFTDLQEGMAVSQVEREGNKSTTPVSGFGARDGQLSLEGFSSVSTSAVGGDGEGNQRENELEMERLIDRTINAMIVLAASSYAITKLLTIDHDYWHAGWKLWPFAHVITYGMIPVEQRLLWVDCVELIWVTILSTYSNEKSEGRISEVPIEASSSSGYSSITPHEE
ncbi:hypothetical protein LINPERPRIM_LOCUS5610 [Linum perenne]